MSNNILKKPIMIPTSNGNNPQYTNFGQSPIQNSSEGQTTQNQSSPSITIQNPQNVYCIYGNVSIPSTTAASAQQNLSNHEQHFNMLENRVTLAIEKFEQLLKAQEEKPKFFQTPFNGPFRPATATECSQNHRPAFGQSSNLFGSSCFSKSFERPFWFGGDNNQNQNSFARSKGVFEQKPLVQYEMNRMQPQMKIQNPNITKVIGNVQENNLDIIDGISKPSGTCDWNLRDISENEEEN